MAESIKDIIAKQLQIDADTIDSDADIFDDLGADSLDVVEILMAIEAAYGISIPDEKVVNMKTIRDITNYLEESGYDFDDDYDIEDDLDLNEIDEAGELY
jgi:acyl carrier protein